MKSFTPAKSVDKSFPVENLVTSILNTFDSIISSYKNTIDIALTIPSNVYFRTKLICEYIEEKEDVAFDVSNFLMLIYLDFLNTSIEKYNPKVLYGIVNETYGYGETLIIHMNDKYYQEPKRQEKQSRIVISISKKDAQKGQLLLDELKSIYGQAPSLEKMISSLWMNFIEEYKSGNPKQTLTKIISLLKKYELD